MRKLGLRALAGGLAVMMVASVFAPAQKANAADVLLIAPAPTATASENTLYVTEDMVDEDGEIVISGGNYDRVVISKEAAAKDIYFDQVTVGELVVESGSNSKIQLWEVDAEKVTVQEPELEELTIKDLLPLLSDPETQQTAINLYMENQAKNKKILNTAPSIVTKEEAKVDALVVRANATLELKDGGVDEVALEASEKIDRAKVTLKNYNGDVSYKGGEAKNSMTLKNVDSRINKLTVGESGASNKLTVTAKDAVVLKAEIAGNAEVSLNAPMGTVEVTEAATAAKIFILGVTDEMIVAANDAQVEVAPCGSVTAAQVTGNNVDVVGGGVLVEVDITGEGAYVSTLNTKVEGVNTYIPPEPYKRPTAVFTDIDLVGGGGAVVTKNADGTSTVVYTPTYQTASFVVPESVDKNLIASVDIELTYNGQFCVKLIGTSKDDDYPGYGTTAAKDGTLTYSINSAREKLQRIDFMCLEAPIEITVKKITFQLLDEAPEAEPLPEATAPGTLPENYLVYNVADLTAGGYGYNTAEAANGGKTYTYGGQYDEVRYTLPEALNVSDYSKMIVTMSYTTGEIAFKLLQGEGEATSQVSNSSVWYGMKVQDTTDIEVSLSGISGTATQVGLMAGQGACDATIYRVAFVPKATQQEPSQPAGNIVYNFEDGIAMVSGNGATPAQAVPATTGNGIWKQISAGGYAAGTIATKLPDGKTLDEMTSVRFDYYIVTEGVQYKPVKVFIGSELENSEAVWNDACVNTPDTSTCQDMTNGQTWGVCTTALDTAKVSALGLAAGADIKLGIGMMWEGATYYIDNVRLVDAEGNEYLLEDFEGAAPTFGVINYGVESSVDNTVDLSVYGESMVQVTNSSWGQGVKFGFTLPEGKTIADYKGLQMNVFLPADAVPVDGQDFTYKDLRVNAGTGDYVALPEGTEYIAWNSAGNVGSWVLVEVANWDTLAAAIGELTTFNIAVGVNTPCQTPYYIDNVTLVAK